MLVLPMGGELLDRVEPNALRGIFDQFAARPSRCRYSPLEIGKIFVYALAFMAVIQAIDLAVLQPWERRATRWRREA